MKAAYKWRLDGNHDLWLIDPKNTNTENYSPKIYDKTTTILTGEEQGVKNIVSSLSKDEYKLLFSQATSIANKEYPNLKFLDVDYYYNLKADGCLSRQAEMTINDVILKATGKVVQIDKGEPSVDIDYSKQTAYEKNLDFTFTLPRLSGDYLPLSGGTINGDLKVTAGNNENPVVISDSGIYPQVNGSRTIGRNNNYFDVGYVLKLYTDSVNVNDLTVKNKIDFRPNYTDPELGEMGINLDANGFYPTKTEKYNIGKKTNKFYEVCAKDVLCNNIIPDNYYSQNITLIGKESAPFNEIHVAKVQMYETEEFSEDEGLKPIKDGKIVCANGTTIDGIYYNTFYDTDQYPDKYETSTFSSLYGNLNNEIFENYGINVARIRTIDFLPLKQNGVENAQLGINKDYPALFWRQIINSRSNIDWKEYLNEHDESKTEGEDGYYLNRIYGKWISFTKIADKKYQIVFKDGGESLYKERISGMDDQSKGLWLYDDNEKKYYGKINNVQTEETPIFYVSFESLPKECLAGTKNITDYKIYFSPYTENGWTRWELAQAEPFCEYYIYDENDNKGNGDPWGRKYSDCIPTLVNDCGHVKFSFMKFSNKNIEGTDDNEELEKKFFLNSSKLQEYWANTIIMKESPQISEKVENTNQFKNIPNNNLSIFGIRSDEITEEPRAFIGHGQNAPKDKNDSTFVPSWSVRELITNDWTGDVQIVGQITTTKLNADSIEAKTEDSMGIVEADLIYANKINASGDEGTINAKTINATEGFFETSDARLKNIIGNVDLDIDKILNLSIIYFTLKNDNANKQQVGVIAQEIAEICPEIVFKDSDGYLSVDYAKMSLLCLYCIKDLYKKINK